LNPLRYLSGWHPFKYHTSFLLPFHLTQHNLIMKLSINHPSQFRLADHIQDPHLRPTDNSAPTNTAKGMFSNGGDRTWSPEKGFSAPPSNTGSTHHFGSNGLCPWRPREGHINIFRRWVGSRRLIDSDPPWTYRTYQQINWLGERRPRRYDGIMNDGCTPFGVGLLAEEKQREASCGPMIDTFRMSEVCEDCPPGEHAQTSHHSGQHQRPFSPTMMIHRSSPMISPVTLGSSQRPSPRTWTRMGTVIRSTRGLWFPPHVRTPG
jgi:hypothetical protein